MKIRLTIYVFFVFFIGCKIAFANTIHSNCAEATASVNLDVNNVRAVLQNAGDMFWTYKNNSNNSGYEIPKGTGKHSSYAVNLILSGVDASGNLYTAGQNYRQFGHDFWPGPLNTLAQTNVNVCREWDKMFSVHGNEINNVINKRNISYNISKWPSIYAPFYDTNADGIYDPTLGDYPVLDPSNPTLIPGQMVYWVYNDKGNKHRAYPNDFSFGIEVHATAYAFTSSMDAINNSTFYKYKIINKSNNIYTDFNIGKLMDLDAGQYDDDYIGCDVNRELFFVYNGDNFDSIYGDSPIAIGAQILNTGNNDIGEKLKMGSFMYYPFHEGPNIGDYYNDPLCLYRFMRGFWQDGNILSYGIPNGKDGNIPCKFLYPGNTDPEGRPYWVETREPREKAVFLSTKTKTFLPGAITHFEFAMVWAQDTQTSNMPSVEKLKRTADTVVQAYNANFNSFSTGINYKNSTFNIYPNPSADFIKITGLIQSSELKIYNQEGKLLIQKNIYVDESIDVRALPMGIYYIQIGSTTSKFMKLAN